ncbi:MAG: DUF1501 domain-containing protein [Planctomycetota bacterium]|nr:MAG: DUF1501 domain-containing protein [Planctomycetota bacterium]
MAQPEHAASDPCGPHYDRPVSRRDFLARAGAGFGNLALWSLLASEARASGKAPQLAASAVRQPHFTGKAKSVIWCFIDGGPSHIDLFDPKPELQKLAGKPLPESFDRPLTAMGKTAFTPLMGTKRKFAQHGQSGIWVSDWLPEIATCVDDIAVVRSCHADGLNHVGSVCQMNTGSILGGRPSLGSWCLYGLGSESQDLPGYVVLTDSGDNPPGGNRNWGTGFMPATFQGTKFRDGKYPILHVSPSQALAGDRQRNKLAFIQQLNQRHLNGRGDDDRLEARIASYELAFRMQAAAPEAVDLSSESVETQALYGLDDKHTSRNGRNCLLARRLVERGVRCVQLYLGSGSKWDAHTNMEGNHSKYCRESDKPVAGLIKDLKRRGMLDDTLVVWGGEFGRTPMSESGNGRDHNPWGFTIWMAGGGVKGGVTYGSTDEIGLYAVDNPAHVNDIHATILHTLGLDHEQLTLMHNGRAERLTGVAGHVITDILA